MDLAMILLTFHSCHEEIDVISDTIMQSINNLHSFERGHQYNN